MPLSGAMIVFPSLLNEYSTAIGFDLITRLTIKPVDSRLRRVLVSIRCETPPTWRRSSPCRLGPSFSENKIVGVHLPIKIAAGLFDLAPPFCFSLVGRSVPDITWILLLTRQI
jgi:hypothetical protein